MRGENISNDKSKAVQASDQITVREAGRRGGHATRDRYQGTGFYQRIGQKGGQRTAELFGELLKEFGRRGGRPRRPNLDSTGEEHPERKEAENAVGLGDSSPS